MGNVTSWLAQCIYPEEQVLWQAARSGDTHALCTALAKLTPETRKYIEWQEPCSGRTALAEASQRGHRACVALLIEAGANCNVKDYRGNTPLHLACKCGKEDVVQFLLQVPNVFPFETNLDTLTPLDLVRNKLKKDESYPLSYERCLEELEKVGMPSFILDVIQVCQLETNTLMRLCVRLQKFCIYSGWLYEECDNLVSIVSGISSLSSWKRRFCIVLERGAPDILELALFSMKPCGMRPVCPTSVVLYQVGTGMMDTTDTKWFNRKDFAFTIRGNMKEKCHYDSTIVMEPLAFAAMDQQSYDAWKCFFTHQQQSLHARATSLYGQPCVLNQQQQLLQEVIALPSAQQLLFAEARDRREPKPEFIPPPSATAATASALTSQEDEDIRRAIWLSLQTTGNHQSQYESDGLQQVASPALPVSAPDWDEDETIETSSDRSGSVSEDSSRAAAGVPPAGSSKVSSQPVVNFGRAPSYSGIGECVICFDGPQAAVCVPCGHNAICMSCAEEILDSTCECPVCREPIRELIKLYRV